MFELVAMLLLVLAIASALPVAVFAAECILAIHPNLALQPWDGKRSPPTIVVLVPAHDEHGVVGPTVAGLAAQLGPADRVLVVADNCTDDTADEARKAGAEVIERVDPQRRGKGYAISYGLDYLAGRPHANPEVVIIADADCSLSDGGLEILAREAVTAGRPIQAVYVLQVPESRTPFAYVSALAFLIRNHVRANGLHRLGLPVHLTGTGMAFPWSVIRAAKPTRGHLVEDRIIGIDLALQGYPPRFCPAVRVVSELPSRDVAAFSQRRRWEHGQLASMLQAGTTLVAAGLRRLNPGLVALGVDLLVPPLALLTLWIMGLLVLSALFAVISGMWLPLAATTAVTAVLAAGVLAGWLRHGRELVPLRYAVAIPFYVLRKIPIYLAFSTGARQQSWERSERTRGRSGANKPEP